MVFRLGRELRRSERRFRQFSVNRFWERLRVETPQSMGRILLKPQSVILLRISFRVLALVLPFRISQICTTIASPSQALVKSTASSVSVSTPSNIFSYFSGILMALIFFLITSLDITGYFFSSFTLSSLLSLCMRRVVFLRGMTFALGVQLFTAFLTILVGVDFQAATLRKLSSKILEEVEMELLWFCSNSSTNSSKLQSSSWASVFTFFLMSSQISQFAKILEFYFSLKAATSFLSYSFSFSKSYAIFGSALRHGPSLKYTPISSIYFFASVVDFSQWNLSCQIVSFPLYMRLFPLRQNYKRPQCEPDSYELNLFSASSVQLSQILTVLQSITINFLIFFSISSAISYNL